MNTDYGDKCELDDYAKMQDLNEKKFKLRDLARTSSKSSSDASGYSKDGSFINIELKSRENGINDYQSLYIETHKAYSLMDDYLRRNKIPLYVNFMNDGHVVVFNLIKLKHKPYMKRVKTWSELYQCYEYQYKAFLKLEDAYIYKREGDEFRLIQKGF